MKTLLAIGDSHTFGAEILGEGKMHDEANKELAYPNRLGMLLGFDNIVNHGKSGGSIMRTERKLFEYFVKNETKPDLVIMGWTTLGRFEYCIDTKENGEYEYSVLTSWSDPNMTNENDLQQHKHLLPITTAEDLLAQKYKSVYACQVLCERYNVPYLMFDVMVNTKNSAPLSGDDDYKIWDGTNLIDQSYYQNINHNNYMEEDYWTYVMDPEHNRGVAINGGHANKEGHQIWAEKLKQELQARNIYGE
tara:strand:+ start:4022 stop:4765 length:744 start_codon:yes stop_codon:yes gene_type:complete